MNRHWYALSGNSFGNHNQVSGNILQVGKLKKSNSVVLNLGKLTRSQV